MNQPWKLILLLTGIFIAGGVTGAFVTLKVVRDRIAQRPMPEQWAPMQLKRLAERLDLRPEQLEQLRPIIKRNMDELNRLRAYSLGETRTVLERMAREVSEQLTPEQRVGFEQMNKEFRERMKRLNADRPGGLRNERGNRERPPGPPPGEKPPPPDKPPGN